MNPIFSFIFSYTPLKFYVQSFWRDEAFSYLLARQGIIAILTTTAKDANPPLYYLLLHLWMLLFGSGEIAIRTISFLFFLATLYVIGLFLMDFFKTSIKWTFLYLSLFALNPLLHYYAFEARMYSMFAFFSTLSFYFLYKKDFRNYFIASLLGLYTHYFMVFAIAAQAVYLIVIQRRLSQKIIALYVKMVLFFIPWLLFVLLSHPPASQEFWIPRLSLSTFTLLPALIFTGFEIQTGFSYPGIAYVAFFFYLFFLTLAYFVLNRLKKHQSVRPRHWPLGLFLASWILVPLILILVLSFIKPVFLPRYTIFLTVGFIFLYVYILQELSQRIRLILVAAALIISLHYGIYQVVVRTKTDIRKPLTEIKHLIGKDDEVYVTDPYDFHPAEYYINDRVVYIYGKAYKNLPWYIGKVLIPADKVTSALPAYPKKAFIFNGASYSVQALY